jgi:hypothetical protein
MDAVLSSGGGVISAAMSAGEGEVVLVRICFFVCPPEGGAYFRPHKTTFTYSQVLLRAGQGDGFGRWGGDKAHLQTR